MKNVNVKLDPKLHYGLELLTRVQLLIIQITLWKIDILSLRYLTKEIDKIAHGIRSHWQIENNLHWVLDVVFREDESRIRDDRTALNFAWFRKMALSMLAKDGTTLPTRRKMLRNWANPENIMNGLKI